MSEEKEQDWYFTFGFGQPHENKCYVINGTKEETRKEMFSMFKQKWSRQYSETQWHDEDGMPQDIKYNLTRL